MIKNVKRRKISGKVKKSIVTVAALLVIGTSTSVFAAQNTEYFSMFFDTNGVSSIFNGGAESDSVVVQSGIKMRIEDSISGGKSSLIIVSFEKEDGSTFASDAFIPTLELETKRDASYMVEQQVTADGKKLVAMFDVDTPNSLDGEKVTVKADTILEEKTNMEIARGPFTSTFRAQENSKNVDINLTITNQEEELSLKHVYVSYMGIGMEGERLDGKTEYLPKNSPIVKVTTKDNKVLELKTSSTSTTDLGFKIQYSLDQDGEKVFLDKSSIKSVEIDNQAIAIQ